MPAYFNSTGYGRSGGRFIGGRREVQALRITRNIQAVKMGGWQGVGAPYQPFAHG